MGNNPRFSLFWLLLPVAVLWFADVILTLGGQSVAFWAGNYTACEEANPVARLALENGPFPFMILAATGFGLLVLLVWKWYRHSWVVVVVIVVSVSHAIGAAAWLTRWEPAGWVAAVAFLFLVANGSAWCWRRAVYDL